MNKTTRKLVYMALYLALFIVLDRISDSISLFRMANGGKLNLGPIVLLLCSYHLGWKEGTAVAFISVFVQWLIGSVTWYGIVSFLFDYLIAYSVYGLASLFPNFGVFYSGILITSILRLISSTIASMLVWNYPLWAALSG